MSEDIEGISFKRYRAIRAVWWKVCAGTEIIADGFASKDEARRWVRDHPRKVRRHLSNKREPGSD